MSNVNAEEEENEKSSTSISLACVGLSPQYWSYMPMMVCDVRNLELVEGVLCLRLPNECLIPVSKCEIHGVITNIQRQAHGAVLYLIDDGTGLLDCLHFENDENDIYSVPPLTGGRPTVLTSGYETSKNMLGDMVSIRGKLRVVELLEEYHYCEVHVSSIETFEPTTRAQNANACHWLRCIQQQRQADQRPKNGIQIVQALQLTLPAEDDLDDGGYFGNACTCDHVVHKEQLLYCHCHAKPEPLDPSFIFRDALLSLLIQMEQQQQPQSILHFYYKAICTNEQLANLAQEVVSNKTSLSTTCQVHRLFINTFRALREDGVIYLLDADTDEYMLLSKSQVLEPYLLQKSKVGNTQYPPKYLRHVPKKRLIYLSLILRQQTCGKISR